MYYDHNGALLYTEIPELSLLKRGKVRDIYELEDGLLFIATDRISAFDLVLPNGIPDKGRILTLLSTFWFKQFTWMPTHFVSMDVNTYPSVLSPYKDLLQGRSMLVKKVEPFPIECVVRGYLIGSAWKDYQSNGCICGIPLRPGYQMADSLDNALFTPALKAEQGEHDENISLTEMIRSVGNTYAETLKEKSLNLYREAAAIAASKGIILADTKFEFGLFENKILLIDEVLTPDSSRFWPANLYQSDKNPPNLDKQFIRDYLEATEWNKEEALPLLPDKVVEATQERYQQIYQQLTGRQL